MTTDYIPKPCKSLRDWLQLQQDEVPKAATTIGMSADELATYQAAVTALLPIAANVVAEMEKLDELTADLQALLETQLPIIRTGVKRAKTHSGYTPGLGQHLSWVGSGSSVDPANSQPVISATAQPGKVRIEGQKPGFDAVNLYLRRKGEPDWKLVVIRKAKFPFYDESPLAVAAMPEVREYRAVGVVNDEEIGLPSVAVEIVYAG
jgi:hypothetical protein